MDVTSVVAELEAALSRQLELAGGEPAIDAAGAALLGALEPAVRHVMLGVAAQVAEEIGAQLPDATIDVVLSDGEPALLVRPTEPSVAFSKDDLEARLTLRLPDHLKAQLEEAAGTAGDSINTYVVKTLASKAARSRKVGRRVEGTIQT